MCIRATGISAAAALLAALSTTGASLAAQAGASKANESNPAPSSGSATSIGVRVGTLGIGLELSHLLSDHIGLRVGGNYFSQNRAQKVESTTYNATAKLQSFTGLLDWYPGHASVPRRRNRHSPRNGNDVAVSQVVRRQSVPADLPVQCRRFVDVIRLQALVRCTEPP